mmetsp:Transcript_12881/g.23303  ORF Transcript_12881/g.23303 Transcript_12881/m.23303 type:complete len:255 (-) Transcript_12881:57-821(-)|eukprot:CAMPEP_0202488772 /NCGR_PEP_ID=MMETSP1361-20130828/6726_1 /ASSEMBLY_ACC=CAM_ASM_000849 /TAXON_ID=210615 /ORGANISM="Staurosira complex sp., Strain CCMP2646" /LENGTH=254 /DNA_ID=CAMNT_0049118419 /DNA_START=862 /DNA_END=1626 /DNA_ORIENTATION=+
MRIVPTALLRRQRQATPESPSSFSTRMQLKAKDKKCSRRANETISKKEERLRDAISVVLSFLNKRGAAVDTYRHNYPAVLTECTEILEKEFRDSLELTKLLSAAWTLLWVHYCEVLRCNAENGQQKTDLEQDRIRCQEFRNKLCFHQVDVMTAVPKESKSSQQQRRRHVFSTEHCCDDDDPIDDGSLRTITALDLEQSSMAVALSPDICGKSCRTVYFEPCGHFCDICPCCDSGVCPICCYNARIRLSCTVHED